MSQPPGGSHEVRAIDHRPLTARNGPWDRGPRLAITEDAEVTYSARGADPNADCCTGEGREGGGEPLPAGSRASDQLFGSLGIWEQAVMQQRRTVADMTVEKGTEFGRHSLWKWGQAKLDLFGKKLFHALCMLGDFACPLFARYYLYSPHIMSSNSIVVQHEEKRKRHVVLPLCTILFIFSPTLCHPIQ